MKSNLAILPLALALLGFSACRNPAELPEQSFNNPFTNANLFGGDTVCGQTSGPDTDGDGTNDECERILGSDPNDPDTDDDGVPDNTDPPPTQNGPPNDQYLMEEEAWYQRAMQMVGPSLIGGSSSLTGQAPSGTSVYLQEQRLRISKGSDVGNDTVDWTEIKNFCGGIESFVYFYVKAQITFCQSGDPSVACQGTPVPGMLRLCGPVANWNGTPENTDAATVHIEDMKWTKGSANGRPFSPELLTRRGSHPTVALDMTPSQFGGSNETRHVKKIRTNWHSDWSVEGVGFDAYAGQYAVAGTPIQLEKTWQRLDLDKYTAAPPKGILGNFGNND